MLVKCLLSVQLYKILLESKLQPGLIGIGNICIAKGRSQDGGLLQIDIEDLFLTLATSISKESES